MRAALEQLIPRAASDRLRELAEAFRVVTIEVKASQSQGRSDTRHLAWLRDKVGDRCVAGIVLYLGDNSLSLGNRLTLLPVSAIWHHKTA